MSNRIKSHNVHRVSVSSSEDDDDDSSSCDDEEASDPNRTGETSNISDDSSYFTGEPGSEDQ